MALIKKIYNPGNAAAGTITTTPSNNGLCSGVAELPDNTILIDSVAHNTSNLAPQFMKTSTIGSINGRFGIFDGNALCLTKYAVSSANGVTTQADLNYGEMQHYSRLASPIKKSKFDGTYFVTASNGIQIMFGPATTPHGSNYLNLSPTTLGILGVTDVNNTGGTSYTNSRAYEQIIDDTEQSLAVMSFPGTGNVTHTSNPTTYVWNAHSSINIVSKKSGISSASISTNGQYHTDYIQDKNGDTVYVASVRHFISSANNPGIKLRSFNISSGIETVLYAGTQGTGTTYNTGANLPLIIPMPSQSVQLGDFRTFFVPVVENGNLVIYNIKYKFTDTGDAAITTCTIDLNGTSSANASYPVPVAANASNVGRGRNYCINA